MCVVDTVCLVASVEYSQVFSTAGFTIARFDRTLLASYRIYVYRQKEQKGNTRNRW